jgi:hypothetical protein
VLGGGFALWLGDNIAILSMEKQAHLFISNKCHTPSTKTPINEIIRGLVCQENHQPMKSKPLPPHHPLHNLERPSLGAYPT